MFNGIELKLAVLTFPFSLYFPERRLIMTFQRIELCKGTALYLTNSEIQSLLAQKPEIFKKGLQRGKAFKRAESKSGQCEAKFSEHEGNILKSYLQ